MSEKRNLHKLFIEKSRGNNIGEDVDCLTLVQNRILCVAFEITLTPIEPQINKPRRGKGCTGSGIIICCRRRVQSVMLPLSSYYFLCHCSKCSFQHIVHGLLVGHSRNINVYVHDLLLFLARAAVCGGVVHHYQQSGCLYWPVLTLQRGPILLCAGSVRHLV